MMIAQAALVVGAYLLGAIPFGAMIARRYGVDILKSGSGNVGATNVHRVIGKTAGLVVSLLDTLKGCIPAVVAAWLFRDQEYGRQLAFWTGMAAVLGHCFSPFLRFRGGKGIATGFGALLGSTPAVAGGALLIFILVIAASRFVSLASIVAAASVIVLGLIVKDPPSMIAAYVVLAVFVLFKHRANVKRLLSGTERKFSLKGGDAAPTAAHGRSADGAASVGER